MLSQAVLDTRASFPDSTLDALYDPNSMPPALRRAHRTLDRAMDHPYRPAPSPPNVSAWNTRFLRYKKMRAPLEAGMRRKRRRWTASAGLGVWLAKGGQIRQMANDYAPFWLELLDFSDDIDERARIWNGYIGQQLQSKRETVEIEPPEGGWPTLDFKQQERIAMAAASCGGRPDIQEIDMDFSNHVFEKDIDLSGLVLVSCNFSQASFNGSFTCSKETTFINRTLFEGTTFRNYFHCSETRFNAVVLFNNCNFRGIANFAETEFTGGADFSNCTFWRTAMFNNAIFEERSFLPNVMRPTLVDFRRCKFLNGGWFQGATFGMDEAKHHRILWPDRRVDFSDAEFGMTTSFHGAVFAGAPAFFNTKLYEDTDFSEVNWKSVGTDRAKAGYEVRAWERLELMMNELQKPLDRHRFFRFKMRARRRIDGRFLRTLNWLFDKTSDYGWGVARAAMCWSGHWLAAAVALFLNAGSGAVSGEWGKLAVAALATGFSNAHAFLFLAAKGGYLEDQRKLLEANDELGLLTVLGVAEGVLGPVFLFLLLLTLRNRFRLA